MSEASSEVRFRLEQHLGGYGERRDPRPFFKGEPPVDAVYFWQKQKAWFIWAGDGSTEAAARKLGIKAQKALIGRRNLPSSVPYLHNRILFVGFGHDWVELPPINPDAPGLGASFGSRR